MYSVIFFDFIFLSCEEVGLDLVKKTPTAVCVTVFTTHPRETPPRKPDRNPNFSSLMPKKILEPFC